MHRRDERAVSDRRAAQRERHDPQRARRLVRDRDVREQALLVERAERPAHVPHSADVRIERPAGPRGPIGKTKTEAVHEQALGAVGADDGRVPVARVHQPRHLGLIIERRNVGAGERDEVEVHVGIRSFLRAAEQEVIGVHLELAAHPGLERLEHVPARRERLEFTEITNRLERKDILPVGRLAAQKVRTGHVLDLLAHHFAVALAQHHAVDFCSVFGNTRRHGRVVAVALTAQQARRLGLAPEHTDVDHFFSFPFLRLTALSRAPMLCPWSSVFLGADARLSFEKN